MLGLAITSATSIELGLVAAITSAVSGGAIFVYSTKRDMQALRDQIAELKAEVAKNTRDRWDRAAVARARVAGDTGVHETVP